MILTTLRIHTKIPLVGAWIQVNNVIFVGFHDNTRIVKYFVYGKLSNSGAIKARIKWESTIRDSIHMHFIYYYFLVHFAADIRQL